MSNYDQFRDKLREIFMMDHAELDFGIYRIMNQKRGEINNFLDKVLLPQVKKILGGSTSDAAKALQQELDKAIKQCQELEIDPNTNKKVIELREKIDASSAGNEELENEVFNHLTIFFSRYYDNGDFVSKRRYKDNAYAIPYNGEEVKLHWANSDQYYIKTSEYFQNYTFNVTIDEKTNAKKKVHFVLKDVTTEQNNNKAASGMERRFALYQNEDDASIEVIQNEDGEDELNIYFTYELMPKSTKQDALMASAFSYIKENLPEGFSALITTLCPTEKDKKRTLLQKHLSDYTAKNSFDYFIHKDLGGFLRRELDFYIKNEVLLIDDLDEKHVMQQLNQVRAIKAVGEKIITMLAQIEDFQKRLWLKKKFVVQSDYCITLDRVPESFYAEICENETQRKEWVRLFAIDEIKGTDLSDKEGLSLDDLFEAAQGYSEPLTEEFLRQHPYLVLDTAFFSTSFKHRLLSKMNDVDKEMNGIMIFGDNFHTNRLLLNTYNQSIQCAFIDPPYNTGDDDFVYKDNYQSSSWLSMMNDRLDYGMSLIKNNGLMFISIGDEEQEHLSSLVGYKYGKNNLFSTLVWEKKKKGSFLNGKIAKMKDYVLCVSKNESDFEGLIGEIVSDSETYPCVNADNPRDIRTIDKPIISKFREKNYHLPQGSTISAGNMTLVLHSNLVIKDGMLVPPLVLEGNWRYSQSSMDEFCTNKALYLTQDLYLRRIVDTPRHKRMKDLLLRTSTTDEEDYDFRKIDINNLSAHGWGTNEDANDELHQVIGEQYTVSYPKPSKLIAKLLVAPRLEDGYYIDFFAGSGTTGVAILSLNRIDKRNRRYILADMGDYFYSVAIPRMKKVIYSEDWKDGKPVSRKGISQCFKYIRLEQYEDTLNNLEVKKKGDIFDNDKDFHESYMLQYMMDMDTRDSLFNIERFVHPFDVKLKTTRDNELVETNVDMVETFNYLIGLEVDTIRWTHGDEICVVEGRLHRNQDKALIIWRDTEKVDNTELNAFFRRNDYHVKDSEFDVIYVNGDNTLQNQKRDDEHWKVVLIEEEFQKRMFEEC